MAMTQHAVPMTNINDTYNTATENRAEPSYYNMGWTF